MKLVTFYVMFMGVFLFFSQHPPAVETLVSIGNGYTLVIERVSSPWAVRILTTRILPSLPGMVSMIRPIGHLIGGVLSSCIRTNMSFCKFGCCDFHFVTIGVPEISDSLSLSFQFSLYVSYFLKLL